MILLVSPDAKRALACILVVDDDEGVRENLAELFEVVGDRVLTASDATAAIEIVDREDVDLLLTDYRMPGLSGVGLIEAARRRKPDLKAILMTAFGDNFAEIEKVRRGATGYINKPFEADEIAILVANVLSFSGR